ncbi:MAG: aldehyde dehydrogenase family protein [Candidatus Competibacterales bacterium]
MADSAALPWRFQNYLDGAFVDGGGGWLAVEDPATGEQLAEQALADEADVDRAVAAARRCVNSGVLKAINPVLRGRKVKAMGDYLLAHKDSIAPLLTRESGKPLWEAHLEIEGAARYFEYYGNQAETLEGRSIPLGGGYFDFTVYEPHGVSAQIIPWNYPLEMTARSLAPALATGNACVVKTPELDPLTHLYLARAAEAAAMPPGAVNLLCGLGPRAGAALAAHSAIDQLVFTGSVATGISIAQAAATNVVPCVLELGGKSAAIVYPDADLDNLFTSVRWGIYFNAGQVCSAMGRLLVHRDIHDRVVEGLVALAKGLSVGPGIERPAFGPNMGALISEPQLERVAALCATAQSEGAVAVSGGHRLNRPGCFYEPTVFTQVAPTSTLAQTEVFGPVLAVLPFAGDLEAVAMANGTPYGLVGGVFTRDLDRAMAVARDLRAGQVFVNEWYAGGVETPFGGYGRSGYGREKGREALGNYVQTKNIAIKLASTGKS